MSVTTNNRRNAIERRRHLHAEIARSRRRLNLHKSRLLQGGFLPLGWRRQIQDHPIMALSTAAGVGMLFAQLCGKTGVAGKSADWLAQRIGGETWASLLGSFEQFLSNDAAACPPSATEQENV